MATFIRPATAEEIAVRVAVETAFASLSDDEIMAIYEAVNKYIHSFGSKRNKAYNKVYCIGKKYGFTVEDLATWGCVEED